MKKISLIYLILISIVLSFNINLTAFAQEANVNWKLIRSEVIYEGNIYVQTEIKSNVSRAYHSTGMKNYYYSESDQNTYLEFKAAPMPNYNLLIDELSLSTSSLKNPSIFEITYMKKEMLYETVIGESIFDNNYDTVFTFSNLNIFVEETDTLIIRFYPFKEVLLKDTKQEVVTHDFIINGFTELSAPPAKISYAKEIWCSSEGTAVPELTGIEGGVYSGNQGLNINATTGVIDVSNSLPGAYLIYYTTPDDFIASTNIIINETPACNISGNVESVCPASIETYSAPEGMNNYLWEVNGNAIISGNNNEQTISLETGTSCNSTFELILTVQNENGCSSTCIEEVHIKEASQFDLIVPKDHTTLPCVLIEDVENEFEVWLSEAFVTGGCNPELKVSAVGEVPLLPPECGNSITVQWKATDDCGTEVSKDASFTFPDIDIPVITLTGNEEIHICQYDPYYEQGAVVANFPDLNDEITIEGEVNTAVPGIYQIKYNVTDVEGNAASEVSRTIVVNELPSAFMSGSICENGETSFEVSLTGTAPWTFIWSDGETEYPETASVSPHILTSTTNINTSFGIVSVTDAGGCTNSNWSDAIIYSGPITTLPIISACANTDIMVPVTVESFKAVRDISLTLKYNHPMLTYTGYEIDDLLLDEGLIIFESSTGDYTTLRISYSSSIAIPELEPNDTLLNLRFHYIGGNTKLEWVNDRDEDCEYSYLSVDDQTGFELQPFCDKPFSTYYIDGSVNQLNNHGISLTPISDIKTFAGLPVIVPVTLTIPELNPQDVDPQLSTDIILSNNNTQQFPEEARISQIVHNGEQVLPSPYIIGGKTEIVLSQIPGIEIEPLLNQAGHTNTWKILIDGITSPETIPIKTEAIVYTNRDECQEIADTKTFSISFGSTLLEVPEQLILCSDQPVAFTASFDYPEIINIPSTTKVDYAFKSSQPFPKGTVINWTLNSSKSGSYTFENSMDNVLFSTVTGEPPVLLQDLPEKNEWYFEITNHGMQLANTLTVEGISVLDERPYTFISEQISIMVHETPEVEILINDNATPTGTEVTFCSNEDVMVVLGDILSGTGPFNLSWETYLIGSETPEESLSGTAENVNSGYMLFSSKLDAGIYRLKISDFADMNGCIVSETDLYSSTITVNPVPEIQASWKNATCYGTASGSITFQPANEMTPYNYSIEPGGYLQNNHTGELIIEGLTSGIYNYTVTDAITNCSESGSFTIEEPEMTVVKGAVRYYSPADLPLDNITIELYEASTGDQVATAVTDTNGKYEFPNICSGTYEVIFSSIKEAGGINTTDAGQVNAWNVARTGDNYPAIEKIRFLAGDVINDIEGDELRINTNDASLIQEYFVTFGNPSVGFDNAWEFWKAGEIINSQPQQQQTIKLEVETGEKEIVVDYYGLVNGDFNSSFKPIGKFKSTPAYTAHVELLEGNIINATKGDVVDLPVKVSSSMQVGALSLILKYRENKVTVHNVQLRNDADENVFFNTSDGFLRISWYSSNPLILSDGDTLITIQIQLEEENNAAGILHFELEKDQLVELADGAYNTIPEARLIMDGINLTQNGSGEENYETEGALFLRCYPNPFSENANLEYTLPGDGNVRIEAYSSQGKKIGSLLHDNQNAGKHIVSLNDFREAPGIYQLLVIFTNIKGRTIQQTIRIIKK